MHTNINSYPHITKDEVMNYLLDNAQQLSAPKHDIACGSDAKQPCLRAIFKCSNMEYNHYGGMISPEIIDLTNPINSNGIGPTRQTIMCMYIQFKSVFVN